MTTCPTCGGSGVYERPDLSDVRIPHILSPYDYEPCDAEGMEQYDHADCAVENGSTRSPEDRVQSLMDALGESVRRAKEARDRKIAEDDEWRRRYLTEQPRL